MKKKMLLALISPLVFVLSCSDHNNLEVAPDNSEAGISGGAPVSQNTLAGKSVVAIVSNSSQGTALCTGTFVAPNIVLTAAHCVYGAPFDIYVEYTNNINSGNPTSSKSKIFVTHPNYNNDDEESDGDLALIKIPNDKPSSYAVIPLASLPATTSPFNINSIGYGISKQTADDDGVLRQVTTTVTAYDPAAPNFLVDQSNGKGICPGDSGGPAQVLQDGKIQILGISKMTYNDGSESAADKAKYPCHHFGQYTNLNYYRQWILDNIEKLSQQ